MSGVKAILSVVDQILAVADLEGFQVSAWGPGVKLERLTQDTKIMAVTTSGTCRLEFWREGRKVGKVYVFSILSQALGPSAEEVRWVGTVRLSMSDHGVWISSLSTSSPSVRSIRVE